MGVAKFPTAGQAKAKKQAVALGRILTTTLYAPYRAAKLAGKKFEAGKKKGGGKAVHSSFRVGFDGNAQQKAPDPFLVAFHLLLGVAAVAAGLTRGSLQGHQRVTRAVPTG